VFFGTYDKFIFVYHLEGVKALPREATPKPLPGAIAALAALDAATTSATTTTTASTSSSSTSTDTTSDSKVVTTTSSPSSSSISLSIPDKEKKEPALPRFVHRLTGHTSMICCHKKAYNTIHIFTHNPYILPNR
jgi:hypothetical protein